MTGWIVFKNKIGNFEIHIRLNNSMRKSNYRLASVCASVHFDQFLSKVRANAWKDKRFPLTALTFSLRTTPEARNIS